LDAPSEVLRNEIVAERTEISDMIIEVARINGVIELEINIQEQEVKLRPIKLEDRLHHMEKVVPLFKELRESLDFDVE
jgi:DNA polymerase-3 subunit gamma/tau